MDKKNSVNKIWFNSSFNVWLQKLKFNFGITMKFFPFLYYIRTCVFFLILTLLSLFIIIYTFNKRILINSIKIDWEKKISKIAYILTNFHQSAILHKLNPQKIFQLCYRPVYLRNMWNVWFPLLVHFEVELFCRKSY